MKLAFVGLGAMGLPMARSLVKAGYEVVGYDASSNRRRAALPLAALAHQLFVSTSGRGDGASDDSQVIRSYAKLNGS